MKRIPVILSLLLALLITGHTLAIVQSGQTVKVNFITSSPATGAATVADSSPTCTLVVNGVDNAASATLAGGTAGNYTVQFTLPTLAAGDIVQIRIAATVATVAGVGVVWNDSCDLGVVAIKTKTDYLPSVGLGATGGLPVVGGNQAITFTSLHTTGDFTIDGAMDVGGAISQNTHTGATVVASVGDKMNLIDAPNATAITALQLGLSKPGTAQTITANQAVNAAQWGGVNVTGMPMPTYAQPTGFLAADFTRLDTTISSRSTFAGGAVASVTGSVGSVSAAVTLAASQHVIVDSGTVTTLTNLPAITPGWLTATGIAGSALAGKGDWSTYAGFDTAGTTTLLGRITATRAGYLDNLTNLDTTISSRLAPGGTLARVTLADTVTTLTNAPTVPSAASIRAEIDSNSTQLASLITTASRAQGMWELNGSVYRFTAAALINAPSSSGSGLTIGGAVTLAWTDGSGHAVGPVQFAIVGAGMDTSTVGGTYATTLSPGTYTIRSHPLNLMLFPDATLAVNSSGVGTVTISGTVSTIPAPAGPKVVTGVVFTLDAAGLPKPGVKVTWTLQTPPSGIAASSSTTAENSLSDSTGTATHALLKGAVYGVEVEGASKYTVRVPFNATSPLQVMEK